MFRQEGAVGMRHHLNSGRLPSSCIALPQHRRSHMRNSAFSQRRPVVTHCSSNPPSPASTIVACPYTTLGVKVNADDKEIKRAFRKLALQHHPDVAKDQHRETAERDFRSITAAYEMLLGRAHGRDADDHGAGEGQTGGWGYHDWYWSFRMQRTWENHGATPSPDASEEAAQQPRRAAQPGFSREETKQAVRSQLAGLRSRATVRASRVQPIQEAKQSKSQAAAVHSPSPAMDTVASANRGEQQQQHMDVSDSAPASSPTSHSSSSPATSAQAVATHTDLTNNPADMQAIRQQQHDTTQQQQQQHVEHAESAHSAPFHGVQNHAVPFPGRMPFRVVQPFRRTGNIGDHSPTSSVTINENDATAPHSATPDSHALHHAHTGNSSEHASHAPNPAPQPMWRLGTLPRVLKRFLTVIGIAKPSDDHHHHDLAAQDNHTHQSTRASHASPLLHNLDSHLPSYHAQAGHNTINSSQGDSRYHQVGDLTSESNRQQDNNSSGHSSSRNSSFHTNASSSDYSSSATAQKLRTPTMTRTPLSSMDAHHSVVALVSMDMHSSEERARREQDEAETRQAEEEPFSSGGVNGARGRKFVPSSDSRAGVSHQLAGLKRKAAIKQGRAQPCA